MLGAASGLVNGAGSVGAVLQGALTAYVADRYGWGALFGALPPRARAGTACMLMSVPKQSKASLKVRQVDGREAKEGEGEGKGGSEKERKRTLY